MILHVHVEGAASYAIGDEIWEEPLAMAIRKEAELIAEYAGSGLLASPDRVHREKFRDRVVREMRQNLQKVGDTYRAPDGVVYLLSEPTALDRVRSEGSLDLVNEAEPTVEEVLRFEDLPPGSLGSRRAIVRWSDGRKDEALSWYSDEILVCEGDLLGKTRAELRSLHFRRDRDWLQS